MKAHVTLKNVSFILCLMAAMAVLSACGGGTTNPDVPTYTGSTSPAQINSDNAQEIATKAIGVGFIDEIDDSGVAALETLSKGLADPDSSLTPTATKSTSSVLSYLGNIFSGKFLPGSMYSIMSDPDFPNLSEEAYTRTITSDDEKSFTITHAFTDALHFSGSADDAYSYTLNGTIVESVTFEYTESDTDAIGGWAEKTLEEKYESLDDSEELSPVRESLSCTRFSNQTQHVWNREADATLETDKFGAGFDGYSAYSNSKESTYELDGSYTFEWTDTNTMDDDDLGTESWTLARTFKGQMVITDHETDTESGDENSMSLTMADGRVSVNLSSLLSRALEDGVITETSNESDLTSLPLGLNHSLGLSDTDMDIIIRGTVTFTSSESDTDDNTDETMSLTLGNATGNFLELKKITEYKSVTNATPEALVSEDETLDVSLTVVGSAQITYSTTNTPSKIIDAPRSETLSLSVTSGNLKFTDRDMISREYTDGNETTEKENSQFTASLSGVIAAEYQDAKFTLAGAITADGSTAYVQYDDNDPTENITKILVTANNLRMTSDFFSLALHGTLDLTMDRINNSNTVEMGMTFSTNGKTYLFEDYLISMSSDARMDKGSKRAASNGIYLEGRFYHPDYGYVDVSTRGNTFVLNSDNLPYSGSITITGADDSAAILKALSDYDDTEEEYIFWYTVSVDEQGDGTYDIVTENGLWPDFDALLDGIPLINFLSR